MTDEPPIPPREALAEVRVRAPTRGNRKLERLLEAANADEQLKAWWHVSAVNATRRLGMSDHSWVHIQIVVNIALRLSRLLFRRGVVPSVVADYGLSEHDAEVVVAAGCLMHCVGMSIHREDHERYSLFLTADKLGSLLSEVYKEPERSIIAAETLHAIIGHRRQGAPFTVEAGIVRVADALDMARGAPASRSRPATRTSTRCRLTRSSRSRSLRGATGRCGSRSRCPTAPASSRSMSSWPRSSGAPDSRSTSR